MKRVFAAALLAGLMTPAAIGAGDIDPDLATYRAASAVSGSVKSIGSDTMNNLMTLWGEEFKVFYPASQIEVEGKGSSTAPPALIQGQAHFGPMSRPMRSSEIDRFVANFGYEPVALRPGIDALAVFVHRDCPLDEISIEQLTQVFSVTNRDMTWGDLGVNDPAWRNRPIGLYGRNSASGTYGFFKSVALQGHDFKDTVKEQPGSSAVVQGIATDRYSMGYSGVGYATADVKMLRISVDGGEAVPPTAEYANTGEYPLARFLYVYVNADPINGLDPLRAEFVKLMFSRQGQEVVLKDGFFPVSAHVAREDLKACGITPDF
ncbi:MAG: phosphate ABC transporter substrate-binding protein PstS family protein [Planctomycetes bacterium]|nr:phosphate ABC transporter substrate-binding protein PstS family protein [Planctomycetota bacterium]